jgi:hypothetical protein
MFSNTENYFRLNQLYLDATTDYSAFSYGILVSAESFKILNCVVKATNSGSSTCVGLNMADGAEVLIYNTIVLDCKSSGIGCYAFGTDKTNYIVCCTICGNGGYGVSGANSSGKVVVWSCYAANNTSGDFRETNMDAPSGWNASKDATADLGGTAGDNYHNEVDLLTGGELDADYLATVETLYEAGAAGARFGRNPYNDLSSVIDFDNFLKNDAAGEAISKKDIIGYDRPTPDTADVSWNVGASQLGSVLPSLDDGTPTGGLVMGGEVVEVYSSTYTDAAATGGLVMGGEEVSTAGPSLNEGISSGGLVMGGEVAEQQEASPNNCVAVKGGTYRIGGVIYTLSATLTFTGLGLIAALVNIGDAPAVAGQYRYDVLSVDTAGTITVTAGTEAVPPVMPTHPADEVKLNHVLRYYGQTSIIQSDIGRVYRAPILTTITLTVTDDALSWGENSTAIAVKLYDQYGALFTGSATINASVSSGNGAITPASISGTASTRTFTYTRGGTTGDVSPMLNFTSPTGAFNTTFIALLDVAGDLMT